MTNGKKIGWRILNTIEDLIIVVVTIIAIMNISMFFQLKVMHNPVPKIFGYSYTNILSGSMEPMMYRGDLAICKQRDSYEIQDVVLFADNGHLVMHRIVDIDENGSFITKGDNNNTTDEYPVSPNNVHGELIKIKSGWGANLAYLGTPVGAFWTILSTLFVYLTISSAKSLLEENESEAAIEQNAAAGEEGQ